MDYASVWTGIILYCIPAIWLFFKPRDTVKNQIKSTLLWFFGMVAFFLTSLHLRQSNANSYIMFWLFAIYTFSVIFSILKIKRTYKNLNFELAEIELASLNMDDKESVIQYVKKYPFKQKQISEMVDLNNKL